MGKRVLVGIGAGVVATALVVGIAAAAYKVGRERGGDTVAVRDGEAVRVVDRHWGRGPGFGFLVFPLLVTGLVVLAVSRWPHRGPGGWGPGGWGPGGPGPGWSAGPEGAFAEWHRRAHDRDEAAPPSPSGATNPPTGPPPT